MSIERWRENGLLCAAFGRVAPVGFARDAERVSLKAMSRLLDHPEEWVHFPLDALVGVQLGGNGRAFQVGLIGNQGAVGLHSAFAPDFPMLTALVLKGGEALRVRRDDLLDFLGDDAVMKAVLAQYLVNSAGGFLAEAEFATILTLERRVARWIATSCRLLERSDIGFTHQDIASALGVRRSGVTVALHILEGEGLIRSRRLRISLLDGPGLDSFAGFPQSQADDSQRRYIRSSTVAVATKLSAAGS